MFYNLVGLKFISKLSYKLESESKWLDLFMVKAEYCYEYDCVIKINLIKIKFA